MIKQQKKKKNLFGWIVGGIVSLLVIGLFIAIGTHNNKQAEETKKATSLKGLELNVPTNVNSTGSFAIGKNGEVIPQNQANKNAIRIENMFDLQCPGCKAVELNSHETFTELMESGKAQFYFTPLSFLDKASQDAYSSRAGSALITVAEYDPKNFYKFLNELYVKQPTEGAGIRVPNSQFVDIAKKVGVSEEAYSKFDQQLYRKWIIENNKVVADRKDALPNGLSTPTILMGGELNGTKLSGFTKVEFNNQDSDGTIRETFERVSK